MPSKGQFSDDQANVARDKRPKRVAKSTDKGVQGKNWMFTLNNPTYGEDQLPTGQDDPRTWGCRYFTFQIEKGESGTEHLQGYCVFEKNRRLAAMKKLNSRAHWEQRKGSHREAVAYCNKEDTRVRVGLTEGDPPTRQGERTDLDEIHQMLKDGVSLKEVADYDFSSFVRYYRGYEAYLSLNFKPRTKMTVGVYMYGETNVGKSHRALAALRTGKTSTWLRQPGNCMWVEKYNEGDDFYFDEFKDFMVQPELLNMMIDKGPAILSKKGGSVNFNAPLVVLCSNQRFDNIYTDCGQDHQLETARAVKRRFAFVFHVTGRFSAKCVQWNVENLEPGWIAPCLASLPPSIEEELGRRSKYDPQDYIQAMENYVPEVSPLPSVMSSPVCPQTPSIESSPIHAVGEPIPLRRSLWENDNGSSTDPITWDDEDLYPSFTFEEAFVSSPNAPSNNVLGRRPRDQIFDDVGHNKRRRPNDVHSDPLPSPNLEVLSQMVPNKAYRKSTSPISIAPEEELCSEDDDPITEFSSSEEE